MNQQLLPGAIYGSYDSSASQQCRLGVAVGSTDDSAEIVILYASRRTLATSSKTLLLLTTGCVWEPA